MAGEVTLSPLQRTGADLGAQRWAVGTCFPVTGTLPSPRALAQLHRRGEGVQPPASQVDTEPQGLHPVPQAAGGRG